jgi:hypothetical protein
LGLNNNGIAIVITLGDRDAIETVLLDSFVNGGTK